MGSFDMQVGALSPTSTIPISSGLNMESRDLKIDRGRRGGRGVCSVAQPQGIYYLVMK